MSFQDKIAQRIQERNVNFPILDNESIRNIVQDEMNDSSEVTEITEFYGAVRVGGSCYSLEFRFKDGTSKSAKYIHIIDTDFDPSDGAGIEILTTTRKFKITGRNLMPLYQKLLDHRIKFLQANIGHDITKGDDLFVKNIEVQD